MDAGRRETDREAQVRATRLARRQVAFEARPLPPAEQLGLDRDRVGDRIAAIREVDPHLDERRRRQHRAG